MAPLLGRAAAGWCAAGAALAALHPGLALGPVALPVAVAAQAALAATARAVVYRARRATARRRPRSTLLVGPEPVARQLAAALLAHPEYGLRPVGLVPTGPAAPQGARRARRRRCSARPTR
ncbi:hypothetical protein O1L44_22000 [Streptomyces noursei]|nr:hypothetical protein [Streptomyces noursei]